jgi:hypothetical protein
MKKFHILFIILGVLLINNAYADSLKGEYEFQERCKKSADEWFQREWGGKHTNKDEKWNTIVNYENHYNRKLNKCFVLLTTTSIPITKKDHLIIQNVLFDINENKEYGRYDTAQNPIDKTILLSIGYVLDIRSSSKVECPKKAYWDELIKP